MRLILFKLYDDSGVIGLNFYGDIWLVTQQTAELVSQHTRSNFIPKLKPEIYSIQILKCLLSKNLSCIKSFEIKKISGFVIRYSNVIVYHYSLLQYPVDFPSRSTVQNTTTITQQWSVLDLYQHLKTIIMQREYYK